MSSLLHRWGESIAVDRVWCQVNGLGPSEEARRRLMVLQAYIDDSTGPSGVYVLAGYIASAETWAQFSKDWEEMLPYGIRDSDGKFHFKMSEMAQNPQRMERAGAFWRIIQNYSLQPISCKISKADLDNALSRIWSLNAVLNWGPWKDPFLFVFRALVDCLQVHRKSIPLLDPGEKIDFIFDNQAKKKTILSNWDDFLNYKDPDVRKLFGATPRFEDDKDFLPIQAADLWAWWIREWYEENCPHVSQDGKVHMVVKGLFSVESKKDAIIISYNEDQIVENLQIIAKSANPDVIIYDSKFEKR